MDAKRNDLTARNFPTAEEDAKEASPPALYEGPGSAYRLAFTDTAFLLREELRPVRMQLELLKPELVQQEQGIESTIVIFGSARILPPETAATRLQEARANGDAAAQKRAETAVAMSHFYSEAHRFAGLVTARSRSHHKPIYVVTGGGPGIMEAGNRGALDAGGVSVSLNIVLPHEQVPNRYGTPELSFNFHYFAVRKMHFLMRAKAMAVFPGGFGTLDELFEVLTLVQTGRMAAIPIVLFGRAFWEKVVDWQALVEAGTIAARDTRLFAYVETAAEAMQRIESWTPG
jgi:uncharacterized protein (TIGR00730 family)